MRVDVPHGEGDSDDAGSEKESRKGLRKRRHLQKLLLARAACKAQDFPNHHINKDILGVQRSRGLLFSQIVLMIVKVRRQEAPLAQPSRAHRPCFLCQAWRHLHQAFGSQGT
jgi:hypothetical protein